MSIKFPRDAVWWRWNALAVIFRHWSRQRRTIYIHWQAFFLSSSFFAAISCVVLGRTMGQSRSHNGILIGCKPMFQHMPLKPNSLIPLIHKSCLAGAQYWDKGSVYFWACGYLNTTFLGWCSKCKSMPPIDTTRFNWDIYRCHQGCIENHSIALLYELMNSEDLWSI